MRQSFELDVKIQILGRWS